MDYKDLSEATVTLRKAYDNIEKLYKMGFSDNDKLRNDFNKLDKALNRFEDIPNYINTKNNQALFKKKDQNSAYLNQLSSSLLSFTELLLNYFSLFSNTKKVEKLLDENVIDNNALISIVKSISLDLDNYNEIKKYGQIDDKELFESISPILYKIIKDVLVIRI